MIRVVVTGSECTGKTTLAEALATRYETVWVPEFARRFVRDKAAAPTYEDVETIARGQIALEDEQVAQATGLLIQDTDLVSFCTNLNPRSPENSEFQRHRSSDSYSDGAAVPGGLRYGRNTPMFDQRSRCHLWRGDSSASGCAPHE